MIIVEHGVTAAFRDAMKSDDEDTRIEFLASTITDDMVLYMFASQFKALSFQFLFHPGIRQNPQEETTRQNLRLHVKFVSASLVYSIYHNRIQMDSNNPDNNPDDSETTTIAKRQRRETERQREVE